MLSPKNRLNKKKDFDKVFKKGRSNFDGLLGVKMIKKNKQEFSRFGVIVSSRISKKAVVRNKIKRRIKNIIAKKYFNNTNTKDVVIISLPGVFNRNYNEIEKSLCAHFKKLKI